MDIFGIGKRIEEARAGARAKADALKAIRVAGEEARVFFGQPRGSFNPPYEAAELKLDKAYYDADAMGRGRRWRRKVQEAWERAHTDSKGRMTSRPLFRR